MARTTADLLYAVKTGNAVPASPSLVDDTRILAFADEEIEGTILPAIYSMNQNYLLAAVSTPIVQGVDTYQITERAMGRTLRELKLYDGSAYRNLVQIQLEDAHLYTASAMPTAFYIFGDSIVLVPTPSVTTPISIVQYYFQRPGRLCSTSDAALVTSVAGTTVTVSQVPSTIAVGTICDFLQGVSGNMTLGIDTAVTNLSGAQLTFSSVPATLKAGDWISAARTTPLIQFPEEAFSLLVMKVSIRVLIALGDTDAANALKDGVDAKMKMFEKMVAPRIQGEAIKIFNQRGLLKRSSTVIRRGLLFS